MSVFDAQEAREAVVGGGRIIDSEDPRSALGNIKPWHIMIISDTVLNSKRDMEVQLSTNIGEDQLLFDRSESGEAIQKSPYEIAGKAAQSAVGVACAMGTRVHPCNLVKVGVDGMNVGLVREVLEEVVQTLNRTEQFNHAQVMSVLFAQDIQAWNDRKTERAIREELVGLREFHSCEKNDPDAFDLQEYAINTLRDRDGDPLFTDRNQISLGALIKAGVLRENSNHSFVQLNELFPHQRYFPQISGESGRTSKAVIKAMVDVTADAGADAIMLDTRREAQATQIRDILNHNYDLDQDLVVVAGDLNDIPANPPLQPLLGINGLHDVLDRLEPGSDRWTYSPGRLQFDYLLGSSKLLASFSTAGIERQGLFSRDNFGGRYPHFPEVKGKTTQASDHAAVWAEFSL